MRYWLILMVALLMPPQAMASVKSVANSIETKVNTVLTESSSALSKSNQLLERVPGSPELAAIAQQISAVEVQVILELLDQGLSPEDIVQIVDLQLQGYLEWLDGGGAAAMKSDLLGVIAEARSIYLKGQSMRCLQNPEVPILESDTQLLETLIDGAPDFLLYGLEVSLNEQEPEWRESFAGINALLPGDIANGLCANLPTLDIDSPVLRINNPQGENFEMAACVALMSVPTDNLARLNQAVQRLKKLYGLAMIIKESTREKVHVGANAFAAAGGGATAGAKNPNKFLMEILGVSLNAALEAAKAALKQRGACEKVDKRMEADLLACNMRVEYLYEAGRYRLQNFYQRAVMPGRNRPYNIDDFGGLCRSYKRQVCTQFEDNTGVPCK